MECACYSDDNRGTTIIVFQVKKVRTMALIENPICVVAGLHSGLCPALISVDVGLYTSSLPYCITVEGSWKMVAPERSPCS